MFCRMRHTNNSGHNLRGILESSANNNNKQTITLSSQFSRTFRNWWRNLPSQHQYRKFVKRLLSRKEVITLSLGGAGGVCLVFYVCHLEEAPFTHRRRFMPISHVQMEELAETEYRNILDVYARDVLAVAHPAHQRVVRVTSRLVTANLCDEVNALKWHVNVINSDRVNAFVLPVSTVWSPST